MWPYISPTPGCLPERVNHNWYHFSYAKEVPAFGKKRHGQVAKFCGECGIWFREWDGAYWMPRAVASQPGDSA